VCALSLHALFPIGFWDGGFSEAHMCTLQRVILATWVRVLFEPPLLRASIRSCCTSHNLIAKDYY
jgi:hypothetical protein